MYSILWWLILYVNLTGPRGAQILTFCENVFWMRLMFKYRQSKIDCPPKVGGPQSIS